MILTASAMTLWLATAVAARRLPPRRARLARIALTATGIPLLGAATLAHGPLPGLLGLAAGTLLLVQPARRSRA